jgi:hypothetical protein
MVNPGIAVAAQIRWTRSRGLLLPPGGRRRIDVQLLHAPPRFFDEHRDMGPLLEGRIGDTRLARRALDQNFQVFERKNEPLFRFHRGSCLDSRRRCE